MKHAPKWACALCWSAEEGQKRAGVLALNIKNLQHFAYKKKVGTPCTSSHLLSLCFLPPLGCSPSIHCVFDPSRSSFLVLSHQVSEGHEECPGSMLLCHSCAVTLCGCVFTYRGLWWRYWIMKECPGPGAFLHDRDVDM